MAAASTERIPTTIGDVVVHVRGSGPSVVLLHTNPGSGADFDAVAPVLARTRRTVAVDWPG
ncbi:MAG: hypothetical protein WCI50_10320 [Actinomycetes bacterium]